MAEQNADLSDAHANLRQLVRRAGRVSSVQLPIGFVKGGSGEPALAKLLGGGQSGEVRLKLFLTYVMRATKAPHTTRPLHAGEVARTLALPDPATKGVRRVQAAMRWLKSERFLAEIKDGDGRRQIQVLNPMAPATGNPPPWPGRGDGNRYLTLPIEFWTNAWICVMSGRELALYLILKELTGGREDRRWTDAERKDLYGLSGSTWSRAAIELSEHGLVSVDQALVGDDYAVTRRRNVYRVNETVMKTFEPHQAPRPGGRAYKKLRTAR
ncbi:hypothetical protein [Promicromonospora iranensis]|uniref:hypothetical protein n=1 Tax=Promicromonospora iranensis TaxID=1105144 RepID=UPI0023A970AC|nr:hypothetical protein [Promicromonospora iranensis]